MNYPKKPGFNLYQLRHCAYITYIGKTWFLKNLSVEQSQYRKFKLIYVHNMFNVSIECLINFLFKVIVTVNQLFFFWSEVYQVDPPPPEQYAPTLVLTLSAAQLGWTSLQPPDTYTAFQELRHLKSNHKRHLYVVLEVLQVVG